MTVPFSQLYLDPISGRMLSQSCWNSFHEDKDEDGEVVLGEHCAQAKCKCLCHDYDPLETRVPEEE